MSDITAAQVAQLIHALRDLHLSDLFAGAAATLVVYDWLLVFNMEYQTIYKSRWTLPKALFYYIRLVTPPGIIFDAFQLSRLRGPLSTTFCRAWTIVVVFGMLSSLVASNGLLTLRLIALYKRNQIVVWFIRIFFLASYLTTFGLALSAVVTYSPSVFYSETLNLCSSNGTSKTMSAIFYAPFAFETFVFCLTAFRAWKDAKLITGASSAPFLTILYRDGIVSFAVMVGMRAWNVWIYTTAPLSSYNMGTPLMWAINTVLTTRIYMNLVWLAKKPTLDSSKHELTAGVSGGIRMRVHTITEVHTDAWRHPRLDTAFESVHESEPSPYPGSPFKA